MPEGKTSPRGPVCEANHVVKVRFGAIPGPAVQQRFNVGPGRRRALIAAAFAPLLS